MEIIIQALDSIYVSCLLENKPMNGMKICATLFLKFQKNFNGVLKGGIRCCSVRVLVTAV